jgi:hypothetical protein
MTISFSTCIYDKTKDILSNGFLRNQLNIINYPFDEKTIIVNQTNDRGYIIGLVKTYFPDFNIRFTEDDYIDVLKYFNLTKEKVNPGYWYSIQNFNMIYHATSDYNFHASSDCSIREIDRNFIKDSIDIMEERNDIISSMPSWEQSYYGPREECIFELDNFYGELGFTDQIYFSKIKEFKQDIYNQYHNDSNKFPGYGTESFERRVDSHMRINKKYRIVHKKSYYIHGG